MYASPLCNEPGSVSEFLTTVGSGTEFKIDEVTIAAFRLNGSKLSFVGVSEYYGERDMSVVIRNFPSEVKGLQKEVVEVIRGGVGAWGYESFAPETEYDLVLFVGVLEGIFYIAFLNDVEHSILDICDTDAWSTAIEPAMNDIGKRFKNGELQYPPKGE